MTETDVKKDDELTKLRSTVANMARFMAEQDRNHQTIVVKNYQKV